MGGVRWSETLRGQLSFDQSDFNQALMEGRRDGADVTLTLSLQVDDIERFSKEPPRRAWVSEGHLDSPDLMGRLEVSWGEFELLGQANQLFDHLHRRMRYRLNLTDASGRRLRLSAFKLIENSPGYDSWIDVTTLFARIYKGSWRTHNDGEGAARPDPWSDQESAGDAAGDELVATAVLRLSFGAFVREMTTFRGTEGSVARQLVDVARYIGCFMGGLAKVYVGRPIADSDASFPRDRPPPPWRQYSPASGAQGAGGAEAPAPPAGGAGPAGAVQSELWPLVPGREQEEALVPAQADAQGEAPCRYALEREIIPFEVEDLAFPLNLHHIRAAGERSSGERGPVLLAHGAGVRAEMFYGQPLGETVVDYLLRHGYDVWALNWRGSIDLPNNSYTLDQVAMHDHPAAVHTVLARTGAPRLRALVHCQGSVSFTMASVAGFLRDQQHDLVSHVVSSAISLFFEASSMTWAKQQALLPLVTRLGKGADPQWGIRPGTPTGAALSLLSTRSERPCNNAPCQIANYIYGSGWDVLLCHENVEDEVHAWSARELGYTPFSLISQVSESHRYGHIVPASGRHGFGPASYVMQPPRVAQTRFTLLGCSRDTMFEPQGQARTAALLRGFGLKADYVGLEGYGHMDAYWGRNSARDVFPHILAGLEWEGEERPSEALAQPPGDGRGATCAPGFRARRWQRRQPSRFSAPPPPRSRVSQPE